MQFESLGSRDLLKQAIFLFSAASWRSLRRIGLFICAKKKSKLKKNTFNQLSVALASLQQPTGQSPPSFDLLTRKAAEIPASILFQGSSVALQLSVVRMHVVRNDHVMALKSARHCIDLLIEVSKDVGLKWSPYEVQSLYRLADSLPAKLMSQNLLTSGIREGRISPAPIFVLGMHRSGTSALAGMLCEAGFDPPSNLMPPTSHNPKGYWESQTLCELNDKVLNDLGVHWNVPGRLPFDWEGTSVGSTWRNQFILTLERLFDGSRFPVIKDPRLCILSTGLKCCFECLDLEPVFLMPIRHPSEVALSLGDRDQITQLDSIFLWLYHVFEAESQTRGMRRVFIDFDLLVEDPVRVMSQCAELICEFPMNLNLSASSFVDSALRHHAIKQVTHSNKAIQSSVHSETDLSSTAILAYQLLTSTVDKDHDFERQMDELYRQWVLSLPQT